MGRRMAELVDIVIDRTVFFNIGVRRGNIGFRLIIIIITDKIFHGVFRKKFPKLAIKLGGKGFIVSKNKSGTVGAGYDVRHGERLA